MPMLLLRVGMHKHVILGAALTGLLAVAPPLSAQVPATMLGVWGKHGRCDVVADRLTIKPDRAGWGRGPFQPVDFDVNLQALNWVEEGEVDNFVMGAKPNVLVHNTLGFHMSGEEGYLRCGRGYRRLSWPKRW
jgi:hypothetical protein